MLCSIAFILLLAISLKNAYHCEQNNTLKPVQCGTNEFTPINLNDMSKVKFFFCHARIFLKILFKMF